MTRQYHCPTCKKENRLGSFNCHDCKEKLFVQKLDMYKGSKIIDFTTYYTNFNRVTLENDLCVFTIESNVYSEDGYLKIDILKYICPKCKSRNTIGKQIGSMMMGTYDISYDVLTCKDCGNEWDNTLELD